METNTIQFTRVNNDVNGNPRYTCNFSHFVTDIEMETLSTYEVTQLANQRAKSIGGKKYNRSDKKITTFVFQSYNIRKTEQDILNLLAQ